MADISDAPIDRPDHDLLGHTEYAKKLSDFLCHHEPPFTIGLYGEWGSGKTSLIQLLRHYVTQGKTAGGGKVCFISFTAWPYRSADELWRALILTIARTLYDVTDPPPEAAPPDGNTNGAPPAHGPYAAMRRFLEQDAWVLRPADAPPDPLADYRDLVAKLDASLHGGISKDSQVRLQLDQQDTILAVANAATAALSTFSPLVGGLRTLFGLDESLKLSNLLQTDKNQSTRERIESIGDFQRTLKKLFDERAKGISVCVFIDDLDRCMPDVALDLLEAIKALLDGVVKCIFIVAADEQLIGQGLKARLRNLLDTGDEKQVEAFYAKKGREYFEKIIQLGVPVPEPTQAQAHRFLSAQFPRWMPVTDLVETAIGTNPRRVKQYCNLLDYRYRVWQMQQRAQKAEQSPSP